jgi:tetratricopeptide (TPR) repeat protein
MFQRDRPAVCEAFCALTQIVLEPLAKEGHKKAQKLLGDCHHYLGAACTELRKPAGFEHCKAWLDILVERALNEPNNADDALELAYAYNETGIAYMQEGMEEEAIKSFEQSRATLQAIPNCSKLHRTLPSINLGRILWLRGLNSEAEDIICETIRDREEAYGKDDTRSFQ